MQILPSVLRHSSFSYLEVLLLFLVQSLLDFELHFGFHPPPPPQDVRDWFTSKESLHQRTNQK